MNIVTVVASLNGQSADHYKMCCALHPIAHIEVKHESDVAAARNRSLTAVIQSDDPWDVCLMLDDDVFMKADDARSLCAYAMTRKRPTAALYPTASGEVRVQFATDPSDALHPFILCGLGALAIPRGVLEWYSATLPYLKSGERLLKPFTRSAPAPCGERWWNEDAWLCYGLGGVTLSRSHTARHRKGRELELNESALIDVLDQIRQKKIQFVDEESKR